MFDLGCGLQGRLCRDLDLQRIRLREDSLPRGEIQAVHCDRVRTPARAGVEGVSHPNPTHTRGRAFRCLVCPPKATSHSLSAVTLRIVHPSRAVVAGIRSCLFQVTL